MPLLTIRDLKVSYSVRGLFRNRSETTAVDGVSLFVGEHEALGLVGESGSGKSTLGKAVLLLIKPQQGSIVFDGVDMLDAANRRNTSAIRKFRREAQIVFQDPYGSLNPRMKAGRIIADPLYVHGIKDRRLVKDKVLQLLDLVGLPASAYDKYPFSFSGGQRQRISIARALSIGPRFIVADEPVSSLDISIQAQLLNLFREIQEREGVSYLFISHDLRTVAFIAQRIAVMYRGRIMELAPKTELITRPLHPYTRLLLSSVPSKDRHPSEQREQAGVPAPGCVFSARCASALDICRETGPQLREVSPGHEVACFLYENK